MRRYAAKVDTTQESIVTALRRCGWHVWILGLPVDLLCWKPSKGFRLLETKSPRNKKGDPKIDKRQKDQIEFIELTGVQRVTSAEAALAALETP